jgi:hypothetical protein
MDFFSPCQTTRLNLVMKPSMVRMLREMREQVASFRADAQKTSSDLSFIEADYKSVRKKVDPLIKSVEQPRKVNWAARRAARLDDRPHHVARPRRSPSHDPTATPPSRPVSVVSFRREWCSPFRTRAESTQIRRGYPSQFQPHAPGNTATELQVASDRSRMPSPY